MKEEKVVIVNEAFEFFLESLRSAETKKAYTRVLKDLLAFLGLKSYSDILKMDVKTLEQQITQFMLDRKKKGQAYNSLRQSLAAIKSFLEIHDIMTINFKKISRFLGESTTIGRDRGYMTEEVRKILEKCDDLRKRIAILLMCATGCRVGAIPELKVGDMKKISSYRRLDNNTAKIIEER